MYKTLVADGRNLMMATR